LKNKQNIENDEQFVADNMENLSMELIQRNTKITKFFNFSILYASLFIIETTCCFLIVIFYFSFETFDLKGSFDAAILWNFWRLLFYEIPFIIFFGLLFRFNTLINLKYKPVIFSIFNTSIFVLLAYLAEITWGNVPLATEGIMFKVTYLSIFLAPLVLGKIPYFKKLMISLL
jgi:hypothetical protein